MKKVRSHENCAGNGERRESEAPQGGEGTRRREEAGKRGKTGAIGTRPTWDATQGKAKEREGVGRRSMETSMTTDSPAPLWQRGVNARPASHDSTSSLSAPSCLGSLYRNLCRPFNAILGVGCNVYFNYGVNLGATLI